MKALLADGTLVFGAGGFARDLVRALLRHGVRVHGFVTSAEPVQPLLDGLPVRSADAQLLGQAPLCIGVFNREAHSDYAALDAWLRARSPRVQPVWPQALYGGLQANLGFRFWLHGPAGYADAAAAIAHARGLLEDGASRAAFDQVLAFRSTAAAHASPPQPEPGMQYLPDWLHAQLAPRGALRVVDGGAYHGETLLALRSRLPVEQAWAFEPDADNHAALLPAVGGIADCVQAGLAARSGSAAFHAGAGEGSHFGTGGTQVAVVALDDQLADAAPNFVKLDVEGHELAALAGATAILRRCRSVLAIAAYHRWDDLWRIPAFIAGLGLGYRLRLGVHGHNSFDTVYYAY